jgi:tetratricopeptide (TPR) repeat protein
MKTRCSWLFLALLLAFITQAIARFAYFQTEQVPIARVLANLERRLKNEPKNVEVLYDLARIHSMAYSTNLTVVPLRTNDQRLMFEHPGWDTGAPSQVMRFSTPAAQAAALLHLTNAITYYQLASKFAFAGTNAPGNRFLVTPIQIGLAWCLDEAGRREDAIVEYRRALQMAWTSEVDLQKRHLGPGVCYSEEIIGYLLKLLDPVKDAQEIAQLNTDRAALKAMPRSVTPILVPLKSDVPLDQLVNPSANVLFDLDGSGLQRRWGWLTTNSAWLVYDQAGSGRITSGLQMFGNVTFWIFWRDGYAALSSLDDNGDGVLSGDELRGLSLWQDLNGNGVCDPGEVRPVSDYGITAIDCRSELHDSGIPFNPRGISFLDGATRATYDWIVPSASSQP